jgi:DNA polymerase-3 subunit alpha
MTQYLKELRPTNVADLAAMIALYRPGPMSNIPQYIVRKHGDEPVEYPHPLLEDVLKDTYGVLTYQDQVLQVLQRIAGYTLGQADIVRKAMGKKVRALMEKEQPRFLDGARANGVSEADALRIWDLLEPFAGYGFNRAHACCYAMVAYQTAYLKANYSIEYMTAVLLAASGNTEKVVTAVAEAQRLNIAIAPPDVNESEVHFSIRQRDGSLGSASSDAPGTAILWGLADVKNVGEAAVAPIVEARRAGPFTSIDDFIQRVDLRNVNKRVLESLIKAGAFDRLGRRAQLLAVLDRLLAVAQKNQKASESGQTSLFDVLPVEPESVAITLPDVAEAASTEKLAWEKDLLGLYLSDHPVQRAARRLLNMVTAQVAELSEDLIGQKVTVGGMLRQLRPLVTKKKEAMIAAAIEDLTGTIEVVAFPRTFERTREVWAADRIVLATGKLEVREDRYQIVVDVVEAFDVDGAAAETEEEPALATVVQIADYQQARRVAESPAVVSETTRVVPASSILAGPRAAAPRKLILQLRRSTEVSEDQKLLGRVHELLCGHVGGSDAVELVICGGGRPRIELEWPALKVRWDRQLHRELADTLGPEAVHLETSDEDERALAP